MDDIIHFVNFFAKFRKHLEFVYMWMVCVCVYIYILRGDHHRWHSQFGGKEEIMQLQPKLVSSNHCCRGFLHPKVLQPIAAGVLFIQRFSHSSLIQQCFTSSSSMHSLAYGKGFALLYLPSKRGYDSYKRRFVRFIFMFWNK